MKENVLLFIILSISFILLIFGIDTISISSSEAEVYYHGKGVVYILSHLLSDKFPGNDFALRLPFVVLHILSLILIYKIGKLYLKRKFDRILSVVLYALLPGINSAAVLVNSVSIVIFLTLLFIYLYSYGYKYVSYLVLIFSLFVDNAFSILYLSLFFYAISIKDKKFMIITLLLFGLSMYIYGFDDGGKPKGYFVDVLGVYAAIFSPFIFLYFVYTLYRILLKEEKNLLWYISFVPFVFSMLLSLRQKIHIEDFAPFVVLGVPLMVRVFFNSYRVRLPVHRKLHKKSALFVFFILLISTFFSFVNKPLYPLFKNYHKHFAYRYHIVKELSSELKSKGYDNIKIFDKNLKKRLKFYGIKDKNSKYLLLKSKKFDKKLTDVVDIDYYGKRVGRFYIYRR